MDMILASASPRRKEILSHILPHFGVCPAAGEEAPDLTLPPEGIVQALARQKAEEVFSRFPASLVLGADTIVWHEGRLLGKPKDAEDAARMLRSLSGKTHRVYTGWCLRGPGIDRCGAAVSEVEFNPLSEEFISEYIAGGSPLDKAGAYGIQDDARLVRAYRGSYTNIVGLPEEELRAQLTALGVIG